jgi:PAS domain S-box-containing protein
VVCDEAGRPVRVLGICLDVTERKQAERALHDSEQSYRMLLRGVRDYAIYMLDAEGRVRTWNEGARRLKGYTADEIVGRHIGELLPPENRASGLADQALAAACRDGQCIAQTWVMRKNGSHFYADIVIDALRDDAGELIGFAKLVRDITTQREAQIALETTREQLAQAQKMEALGQLTGGIAHDFNNLLMIVSGYAQILQRRLGDEKQLQAVQAIRAAAARGEKLTRQLLTFSRRQHLSPVVVDLRARIEAVRDMLKPSLHANIELVHEFAEDVWPVEVDLGELELSLVNIIVNARDALPDGGTVTVSATNVTLEQGVLADVPEGDFVAIAIVDTGEGIAPDVLKRVFEPFFTTKPVGKGTGLGLSQVHGFASQSGGAVTVVSEPGRGTTVTIYLPRSRAAVAAQTGLERIEQGAAAQGNVLMVEDNRDVAAVSNLLLQQLGYSVVGVENASEALALLEQGSKPDLIFSDIVVPGPIDGLGLAQICRERYPDIPVLLTSGFSDAARDAEGRFEILRKPFELSALARAIDGMRRRA